MNNVKVGDLVRVLPGAWPVGRGLVKAGEIAEVKRVYEDGSGLELATRENESIPVTRREYTLFSTTKEPADSRESEIKKAAAELGDLLARKNRDYGSSFTQQYEKYGLMSALIRMDDKMRRLETLQGGQQAKVDESISDTLLDLAGYALLAYLETKTRRN